MDTKTCRHFNGIMNKVCKIGIAYKDVVTEPDRNEGWSLRLPCLTDVMKSATPFALEEYKKKGTCDKLDLPTAKEVKAHDEESHKRFAEHMEKIKNNICPTHNIAIVKKQVGRCVYAEPCGCRLYQGTI